MLSDLNVCSQRGLVERFDSSIGAGSVLMPYGGKYQLTETQTMVAKVPVLNGDTTTVTMMSYGFDPYLSSWSPYHGAAWAVTSSVAKIAAAGGDYKKIRFTFQEYFRRMTEDPHRWSQPFTALLGAYKAQIGFGLPSIGGKDSMSGTFEHIDVPPTLVSFAVDVAKEQDVVTPEFKEAGNAIAILHAAVDENALPDFEAYKAQLEALMSDMKSGAIVSAYVTGRAGAAEAITKMAFGNCLGAELTCQDAGALSAPAFADIVMEVKASMKDTLTGKYEMLGCVIKEPEIRVSGEVISLEEALKTWEAPLEKVFKSTASEDDSVLETPFYENGQIYVCKNKVAKPHVFIPVFQGTNCEYDSTKAFEKAGAEVSTCVFRNLTADDIRESVDAFAKEIENAQIIMFPGGFSAGDEPEGSAKFFATAFQNAKIKEAVMKLLNERDGLALGICNGFQALIKLGLVPYGEITGQVPDSPTLTFNTIGRHISRMVYTKIVSNKSPWLSLVKPGDVITSPASHGEGRFVASKEWIDKLFANGQVATQYCDPDGVVTMADAGNINGSYAAIEGITSPDGRIFGKMAHIERIGRGVAVNIFGEQDMKVFEAGVKYFK